MVPFSLSERQKKNYSTPLPEVLKTLSVDQKVKVSIPESLLGIHKASPRWDRVQAWSKEFEPVRDKDTQLPCFRLSDMS